MGTQWEELIEMFNNDEEWKSLVQCKENQRIIYIYIYKKGNEGFYYQCIYIYIYIYIYIKRASLVQS